MVHFKIKLKERDYNLKIVESVASVCAFIN